MSASPFCDPEGMAGLLVKPAIGVFPTQPLDCSLCAASSTDNIQTTAYGPQGTCCRVKGPLLSLMIFSFLPPKAAGGRVSVTTTFEFNSRGQLISVRGRFWGGTGGSQMQMTPPPKHVLNGLPDFRAVWVERVVWVERPTTNGPKFTI